MNSQQIATLEHLVQGSLRPDLTLLLDVSLDVSATRAQMRNASTGSSDRFEREQRDFFERVRNTYLARAREHDSRFVIIDAGGDREGVAAQIRSAVQTRLSP
jgi:dTMP kinase